MKTVNVLQAAAMAGLFLLSSLSAYTGDYLATMPANKWIAFPSTKLMQVVPDLSQHPEILASSGYYSITGAWSGGAFDTRRNRLIVWGGGHNDYWGNELYAFDVDSLRWMRLTDPCTNPNLCGEVNPDSTPNSRHTYAGLAYLTQADRFFACGGALACQSGMCGSNPAWTFDFDALKWKYMRPSGVTPATNCEDNCAYDTASRRVFYFGGYSGLFAYSADNNSWSQLNSDGRYAYASVVDPKRGLLFSIGSGNVFVYDIAHNNYTPQAWTTTGGASFISQVEMGLEYDPVMDAIVGWNGGSVYALNPDTKVWTAWTAANAPTAVGNGTFGRWRYIPKYNAYIVLNSISENVYFYKLTAGGGNSTEKTSARSQVSLCAFPNPFAASTEIRVSSAWMTQQTSVTLTDIRGRVVLRINSPVTENAPGGIAAFRIKTGDLENGVYFLAISGAHRTETLRLLRVR